MKLFGNVFFDETLLCFYSTDLNPFRFQRSPRSLPPVLLSLSIDWKTTLTSPGGRSYQRLSWLDDSPWQPLVAFVLFLWPFVNSDRILSVFVSSEFHCSCCLLVIYWMLCVRWSHFADSQHWKSRVRFAQKSPRDCSAKTTAGEHTHRHTHRHTCTYRVWPCLLGPQERNKKSPG